MSTRASLFAAGLGLLLAGCASRTIVPDVAQPPAAARPVFYPLPPDPPRIQYLTAINTAWDVEPPAPKRSSWQRFVLGKEEKPPKPITLKQPYGVAVWQGKIYVCDRGSRDVRVFDLPQKKVYNLSGKQAILTEPTNLHIDRDGYKFIVESMPQRIQVFGPDDQYLASFAIKDGRPGDVVAIGDELFVSIVRGGRIDVLDRSTGKVKRSIGKLGTGPGQLNVPTAMAADSDGNLYVCELFNYRFQKLDRNGKSLLTVGGAGRSYGQFQRPRGVAVAPDGVIYVVESVFDVVQMFDQKGQPLMGFGNFRGAPGFMVLGAGIALDTSCMPYFKQYVDPRFEAEYLIFLVSQSGTARVGVYAFGHLKPGAEIPAIPALEKRPPTPPEKQPPQEPDTSPPAGAEPKPTPPSPSPPPPSPKDPASAKPAAAEAEAPGQTR